MDATPTVTELPKRPFGWSFGLGWYFSTLVITMGVLSLILLFSELPVFGNWTMIGAVAWIVGCFVFSTGLFFFAAKKRSRLRGEKEPYSSELAKGMTIAGAVVGIVSVVGFWILSEN